MEFLLQKAIKEEVIYRTVSEFYNKGSEGYSKYDPDINLFNLHHGSDFPLRVSVYEQDEPYVNLAIYLAKHLLTNVIISNDSLNPFEWLLVDTSGELKIVYEKPIDISGYFELSDEYKHLLYEI